MSEEPKEFTPRIVEKTVCPFCEDWHPTAVLCANGHTERFTLDSFHIRPEMRLNSLGITERDPTDLERCISARMDIKGLSQEAAEQQCQAILADPMYRHSFVEKPAKMDCRRETQSEEDKFVAEGVSHAGWHPELAKAIYDMKQREKPKFFMSERTVEGLDSIYRDGPAKTKDELVGETVKPSEYHGRLTVGDIFAEEMKKRAKRRQDNE